MRHRECTYNAGLPGGDSGYVVIQEAEGPQDPGVPVCIFSGPILEVSFPYLVRMPLNQTLRSMAAKTRANKKTLGMLIL